MVKNLFQGKKVTVMGLGLHGGGVAVVLWLVKHGAKVTVTDLKTKKELEPSLRKLTNLPTCKLILGRHREIDFKNADLIIQNPGVPRQSKYLKIAEKAGILTENDASLFFKNCPPCRLLRNRIGEAGPAKIIGVTGTRGKSTTASLIYELLQKTENRNQKSENRNQRTGRKVWLAGLPQKPMLEILDQIKTDDLAVLELSSWQLEILGQQKLSPNIALVTNIYPDHLNRYLGMADYIAAKKNIISWQKESDFAILNLDNSDTRKMGQSVAARRFWFSKKEFKEQNGSFVKNGKIYFRFNGRISQLASLSACKLKGEHNLENILAALTVAGIFGVKPKEIKSALANFNGLPGRIEFIRQVDGVDYVNDTTATTPDGTIAALNTLQATSYKLKAKNIILIAGGATKNIPEAKYRELAGIIKQTCKAVVLFSGEGSEQIAKQLKKVNYRNFVFGVNEMLPAVSLAKSFAKSGSTILLSPACASFNLFIHEYDRGDQFNQIVLGLKK
ncbi:MAG: UDP-N-acetylmuramoyl-L-alanine--D-glutamate ligase [Patescibacteria group bacterium]|jgi:UDP-N-acetylmuramoylalanine--D-glutamate ligase